MILHPKLVIQSIARRSRSALKNFILQTPLKYPFALAGFAKPAEITGEKIVNQESVFNRHVRICKILSRELELVRAEDWNVACEIGAGDCLASSDLLLGVGFQKVYVVEKPSPSLGDSQIAILSQIAALEELPNNLDVIENRNSKKLNTARVTMIEDYFEYTTLPEQVDLLFSFDVLEHVENIRDFFQKCHKSLRNGGVMIHKFDLSGHGLLEDPIPPLDFQTYPDWLYGLMYPKYSRAVRNTIDIFQREIQRLGFKDIRIQAITRADTAYIERLRPHLRRDIAHLGTEELAMLDVVVTASK
jgi:SAM-dependent methyltransferase